MSCVAGGAETLGPGGYFAMESVATFTWNQWQLCRGIDGNFRVESVAVFSWNGWQLCRGISGNFRVEYACNASIAPQSGGKGPFSLREGSVSKGPRLQDARTMVP